MDSPESSGRLDAFFALDRKALLGLTFAEASKIVENSGGVLQPLGFGGVRTWDYRRNRLWARVEFDRVIDVTGDADTSPSDGG